MKCPQNAADSIGFPPQGGIWKKCEKAENLLPACPAVEVWKNCGVERENLWKILWKIRQSIFNTVESVKT